MRRITMITAMMATTLAGCSTLPNAPEAVRAPEGQKLALGVFASGVQVYECAAADNGARYEWKFKAPDATLLDFGGRPMGTHYAGPTWKAPDGSTVVAEVRSRAPAKDAIPLLLLARKGGDGDGVFSQVRSIQRLDTVGGLPPDTGCNATQLARVARVPYTANYYFYK